MIYELIIHFITCMTYALVVRLKPILIEYYYIHNRKQPLYTYSNKFFGIDAGDWKQFLVSESIILSVFCQL